jgi:membrane protease subunit HflC
MQRNILPILIAVGALLIVLANTFFTVGEARQAIVLRLGKFERAINVGHSDEAGLHIKIPFVESVLVYDKRNLGLQLREQAVVPADQERLIVDAMVRWRIVDPRLFFQAAGSEVGGEDRLSSATQSALRRTLGQVSSTDIISGRRGELMQAIENDLNRRADSPGGIGAAREFGVYVVDVRIRQADLPPELRNQVFERMRTERRQVAARIRSEGEGEALRIRAEAEREVIRIQAEAREQAERIRGAGDAERARIYSSAYGRDPEFASFYRSMRAYETALPEGTPIVTPAEGDFFRYLRSQRGGR